MRIKYSVRLIRRADGKTEWGVYENDHLVDTFISKERAQHYLAIYRRLMR